MTLEEGPPAKTPLTPSDNAPFPNFASVKSPKSFASPSEIKVINSSTFKLLEPS